jgi:hypothetical protein
MNLLSLRCILRERCSIAVLRIFKEKLENNTPDSVLRWLFFKKKKKRKEKKEKN